LSLWQQSDYVMINLSSCSAGVTNVEVGLGDVTAHLGCAVPSSARPHDGPRVPRWALLRWMAMAMEEWTALASGVIRGEGEVVLPCEAELADELFCVFDDAATVISTAGRDELSELIRRHLLVLGCLYLAARCVSSSGKHMYIRCPFLQS